MLSQQLEEFEERGLVVLRDFLSSDTLESLEQAIDNLQRNAAYDESGRWSLRNCLPRHHSFVELMVNETLLRAVVQILNNGNIKLLGSHVVKMKDNFQGNDLAVDWHRDGGVLASHLPDPLPPAFVKAGFCISGSTEPDGGQLLMALGSHRMIGEPVKEFKTGQRSGSEEVRLAPGDLVIFDWRTWHAVKRNSSSFIRRMLYFTFGFRILSPMDYVVMPEELLAISPWHRQLLGGATESGLGNYLPTDEELPLMALMDE